MEIVLKNLKDTQKLAVKIARDILRKDRPSVIALYGDLGAGKTTFVQFMAKALGIKEKVLSPTFTIIKTYVLPTQARSFDSESLRLDELGYKFLRHIDTYRLKSAKELLDLGFRETVKDKENIVVIEWPEKAERYLPADAIRLYFEVSGEKERKVTIENF